MAAISRSSTDSVAELAQLLEHLGALGHHLAEHGLAVERLLAEEGAERGAADVQRLARVLGARVGGVAGARGEPLGAERLAGDGEPGDEAAPGLDAAAQHHAPAEHDEQPVGRRAALVDGEAGRPGGLGAVARERGARVGRQPREGTSGFHCETPVAARTSSPGGRRAPGGPLRTTAGGRVGTPVSESGFPRGRAAAPPTHEPGSA
jgi:hypothetical protein